MEITNEQRKELIYSAYKRGFKTGSYLVLAIWLVVIIINKLIF